MADTIEVDGKQFAVDEEGYLSNLNDWVPEAANVMAKPPKTWKLTEAHWDSHQFPA
jgi:dissimilatory sulfite reductase related protein